jgi:hypothetical protein
MTGWGVFGSGHETPAQRAAAARAFQKQQRARIAAFSLNHKAKLLARAILSAAAARGIVTLQDGIQSGLTRREVESLWPQALEIARATDARLPQMVAP